MIIGTDGSLGKLMVPFLTQIGTLTPNKSQTLYFINRIQSVINTGEQGQRLVKRLM